MRSGLARLIGQAISLALKLLALVVLARLLSPSDFGIAAMVTVITGVLDIFNSSGISSATIQAANVTHAQISRMFWINVLVSSALAAVCVFSAPIQASFYHEPRLIPVAVGLGLGFVIAGFALPHAAILQRNLRFVTLTTIESGSALASTLLQIYAAATGWGYMSFVVGALSYNLLWALAAAAATRFIPDPPWKRAEVGSMLRFGSVVTLNTLIVYIGYNIEKVLLGRTWGADALGQYGRAYSLTNMPAASLNAAFVGVSLSALSRLQHDLERLKSYFLTGYGLLMSITAPLTLLCWIYAEDIVAVALGPKWAASAEVFRLLSPTVLTLGIINPLSPLMLARGQQRRSLALACIIAPLVLIAVVIGLPYGPTGVATAYSTAMILWCAPHVILVLRGTNISPLDLVRAVMKPAMASIPAGIAAWAALRFVPLHNSLLQITLGVLVMGAVYCYVLLIVLKERQLYVDLVRGLLDRRGGGGETLNAVAAPASPAASRPPRVDVVIPSYQYGRYLRECVASVLSQDGCAVRVLIIDNASTDDSAEVARALAAADPRVEARIRVKNMGPHASYNEGVDWASGDYFMVLCADDWLAPGALARAIGVLEGAPDLAFAYGREIVQHASEPVAFPETSEVKSRRLSAQDFILKVCPPSQGIGAGAVLVRTSAQKAAGHYSTQLRYTFDLEMLMRLSLHGGAAEMAATQGVRRTHEAALSSAFVDNAATQMAEIEGAFDVFFAGSGQSMPDAHAIRAKVGRIIAGRCYWGGVSRVVRGRKEDGERLLAMARRLSPISVWAPPIDYLVRLAGARMLRF